MLAGFFGLLALGLLRAGWLGFIRELTLYLFLPLPFLIAAALLSGARGALGLALLPSLLFAYFYGPQLLPHLASDSRPPRFRVLTFNAGGQEGGGQLAPLLAAIRAEGADVLALQELPRATLGPLEEALVADYPYQAGTTDAVTLSRFPLLDTSSFLLQEDGYLCQSMDVVVADRLMTLFNVHVRRPSSGMGVRRDWLPWARRYDADWRDGQVAALLDRIRDVDGPLLVMGDFNQTEWSSSYLELTAELQDSFRAGGWGFGYTYPNHWGPWQLALPLLRIDYVFHSPELVAVRAHVGRDGGSYHLPVVADLAFR